MSSKNEKLIRVHSAKIGKALGWLDSATKSAIIKALRKAGIPKGDTNKIAELLLWLA
ncbi:hypothetical protein [Paludifilum halophilum]|uniref:hypothetical protein n=1 Tax=Paludifilum halophilum TaxID=1642702 RepID=UPI00146C6A62|nr:hypothetical protein [Paludifilum halophilum]